MGKLGAGVYPSGPQAHKCRRPVPPDKGTGHTPWHYDESKVTTMYGLPSLSDRGAVIFLILGVIIGLIIVGVVSAVREKIGR